MRRIIVVLGVCALAAASTALAAGGSSAEPAHARLLPTRLHRWVLPGVGHAVLSPEVGQTCFISSANQECGLSPCKAFVAASSSAVTAVGSDDVPITPSRCPKRPPTTLVRIVPLPAGALHRLTIRPR